MWVDFIVYHADWGNKFPLCRLDGWQKWVFYFYIAKAKACDKSLFLAKVVQESSYGSIDFLFA